jgi:hypothetical protein
VKRNLRDTTRVCFGIADDRETGVGGVAGTKKLGREAMELYTHQLVAGLCVLARQRPIFEHIGKSTARKCMPQKNIVNSSSS